MKENDILQAQDVRFRYDTEQPNFAVDGVSMEVHRGEFVAVLGANGCGKSTLAKHFNAILLPESGTVLVEDMDTRTDEKLYDIRIDGSLCKEIHGSDLLCFFLEYRDKFCADDLTLLLRLGQIGRAHV